MTAFTPPEVPEGLDPFQHIFATMNAVQGWQRRKVRFTGITIGDELRFEMLTSARMRTYSENLREPKSAFGMPIEFTQNPAWARRYTVSYEEV